MNSQNRQHLRTMRMMESNHLISILQRRIRFEHSSPFQGNLRCNKCQNPSNPNMQIELCYQFQRNSQGEYHYSSYHLCWNCMDELFELCETCSDHLERTGTDWFHPKSDGGCIMNMMH